uniref:Uncharacterized protein n=1 Tax=Noccaea caerulescens TaxID=107243 RepID=A0A1J3DQ81_NOCCA
MSYSFLLHDEVVLELRDFFVLFFLWWCLFVFVSYLFVVRRLCWVSCPTVLTMGRPSLALNCTKEESVQRLSLVFFIFVWQLYACFLASYKFLQLETDVGIFICFIFFIF